MLHPLSGCGSLFFLGNLLPGSRNSAFEIIPARMNVLRGGHQSVYDWRRNHLYCLGGYGGRCVPRINGMGRFVPEIISSGLGGGFQMCQNDMSVKRTGAGADFGEDGAIYVVGGSPDGARGHNSLERYDPRVGKWEKLASMEHRRGYLAAKFAPNGNLYAAGGSSLEQFDLFVMEAFHEEIEVYDPRLDVVRGGQSLRGNCRFDDSTVVWRFLKASVIIFQHGLILLLYFIMKKGSNG